jgi:hypothetical protein
MNELISAKHIIKRDNCATLADWIRMVCQSRGGSLDPHFTGKVSGDAVTAIVESGRWIAKCECGGAEYVSQDEPIFFCFACANFDNGGDARPVTFPQDMKDIEWELCKRPIVLSKGGNMIERVFHSASSILPRSWSPPQTADELKQENEEAGL